MTDAPVVRKHVALDPDVALGRLAVTLMSGVLLDVERGAAVAIPRRLAGLFLYGLSALDFAGLAERATVVGDALRRAALREAAENAAASEEIAAVLNLMRSRAIVPAVLKGRPLALAVWPQPAFRPPGDLDLLVELEALPAAVDELLARGYRPVPREPPGRFRPLSSGAMLAPPEGGLVTVDLHTCLFRSVGHRIDTTLVLARSRPASLEGHPVRELDKADRLLFLLVHAAKHGASRIKWLLDLYAVALRTDAPTWGLVEERAAATRTKRALFASARLLAELPGVVIEPSMLEASRPAFHIRRSLTSLITCDRAVREVPPTRKELYALEFLLEESVLARARMACGVLERLLTYR